MPQFVAQMTLGFLSKTLAFDAFDGGFGTWRGEALGLAGFTNNYANSYTDYKNGVDFHLDWGASQFLSKQLLIGAVGYVYNQLTGDSGSGAQFVPNLTSALRRLKLD
jgi:hypothetical protein